MVIEATFQPGALRGNEAAELLYLNSLISSDEGSARRAAEEENTVRKL